MANFLQKIEISHRFFLQNGAILLINTILRDLRVPLVDFRRFWLQIREKTKSVEPILRDIEPIYFRASKTPKPQNLQNLPLKRHPLN